VTFESLRAKWEELAEQGLRLIDFEIANPGDGVADVADLTLANVENEYQQAEVEEFGGIFGRETSNDISVEEGGGGLGEEHGGTRGGPESPSNVEVHGGGGAYFAGSSVERIESEGESGGALFDVATGELSSEKQKDFGGAVFPHRDA
jgi:hypothetical protein